MSQLTATHASSLLQQEASLRPSRIRSVRDLLCLRIESRYSANSKRGLRYIMIEEPGFREHMASRPRAPTLTNDVRGPFGQESIPNHDDCSCHLDSPQLAAPNPVARATANIDRDTG